MSAFTLNEPKKYNHTTLLRYLKKGLSTWKDMVDEYKEPQSLNFDVKDDLTMNFSQIIKYIMFSFKAFREFEDETALNNQLKQVFPSAGNDLIQRQLE
jgi:hypothetical protein